MLSLYIHIPFCVRKCHYCGFYSTAYSSPKADAFLQALEIEIKGHHAELEKSALETIYIGGGTPTALSEGQLSALISIVRRNATIAPGAEWTIEANPNSMSERKLALVREGGVNRLSLGVQSFSDALLQTLGRLHNSREAGEAFLCARNAGFTNIGLDLIYGVPGQSGREWTESLDRTLLLKPEHLSLYCLSLDEGSRFAAEAAAGRFSLPDDEATAGMYETALDRLHKGGYERYEISNFSLPGYACRHNMNYWRRGEYLGLGPSAWSFQDNRRWRTVSDTDEYIRLLESGLDVTAESETINAAQAASEFIMLGLRTREGMDLGRYEQQFGAGMRARLEENIGPLRRSGLVLQVSGRLVLSDRGILLSNDVTARLSL